MHFSLHTPHFTNLVFPDASVVFVVLEAFRAWVEAAVVVGATVADGVVAGVARHSASREQVVAAHRKDFYNRFQIFLLFHFFTTFWPPPTSPNWGRLRGVFTIFYLLII